MKNDTQNDIINWKNFEAIVIGVSAGGLHALKTILSALPTSFTVPILIVQHQSRKSTDFLPHYLNDHCVMEVKEADEKEIIANRTVYIAPPDYHLLIENDRTLTLTTTEPVNYSRPSIDVLFETAADAYQESLIGIILTGANSDGCEGLHKIKEYGGLAIVQDPKTAQYPVMPEAAIKVTSVDYILPLEEIGLFLAEKLGE